MEFFRVLLFPLDHPFKLLVMNAYLFYLIRSLAKKKMIAKVISVTRWRQNDLNFAVSREEYPLGAELMPFVALA